MTDLDAPTEAPAVPWHLAGNFGPVTDELDVDGLEAARTRPNTVVTTVQAPIAPPGRPIRRR